MNTLFPIEPAYPSGFSYTPDFLTVGEESELIKTIKEFELINFNFHGFTANRKVLSFGYDYSFDDASLNKTKDIPSAFDPLINKACSHLLLDAAAIAELLIIEYPPGAVMNWHRDAPPFGIIIGISLMSDCKFKFRPHDKSKQGRSSIINIPLKRRSLYMMQGEARSEWQHSVSPVKETRYSITLRTLREGEV